MEVKRESEVTQSCLTLCDRIDGSPPGPSVHGIFQARVLEWGAIAISEALSGTTIYHGEAEWSGDAGITTVGEKRMAES